MRFKQFLWLTFSFCTFGLSYGQTNYYTEFFRSAYQDYPTIPKGLLEAVAWNNTHIRHLTKANTSESCTALPFYYGVMGLVEDGKSYFRNSLNRVSELSGYSTEAIKQNPETNIRAYAAALSVLQQEKNVHSNQPTDYSAILVELSELPIKEDKHKDFVLNTFLYSIFSFLNDKEMQQRFHFPDYHLNLETFFGKENFRLLSSSFVNAADVSQSGKRSADYAPALWNPTTCNYSSRSGTAITAVAIHTTQGSYAGTISWFKNCSSEVSAHYVIRSSDGQVTQMVAEADKAWHVRTENPYTIGIEHEGFVEDSSWYTNAMYSSSAALVRDIVNSGYGINPLSTYKGTLQTVINECYRIKGHVHFPNQTHTDPGVFWNWQRYYNLINNSVVSFSETACTGNFVDHGGTANNYSNFEKYLTVIEPSGAASITISFTAFSLEPNYDFLHIYDGEDMNAPLIGSYTGTAGPGTITSSTGKIAMLFESDCIYNDDGWQANWSCNAPTFLSGTKNPVEVNAYPNPVIDMLYVKISGETPKTFSISVFDGLGKNIYSNPNSGSEGEINFNGFPAGVYHLVLQTEEKYFVKKVVKF